MMASAKVGVCQCQGGFGLSYTMAMAHPGHTMVLVSISVVNEVSRLGSRGSLPPNHALRNVTDHWVQRPQVERETGKLRKLCEMLFSKPSLK